MGMRDYRSAIRTHVVLFDGGMGATLEQFDLSLEHDYKLPGRAHEALVLNRPDVIEGVHTSFLEAGADVVQTDTFQASRLKLDEWGLGDETLEINRRGAEIARKAAGEKRYVAGSVGPTGFLPASDDPTLGNISFRTLADAFSEQCFGLIEGGVDVILIETAQDILEVKAAIFGARAAMKLAGREVPIQTQVSLLPNGGKMLLGTDISAVLATLEALNVDAIGLNCSTGPEDMRDAIRFLGEYSPVPVSCIPNAGIPIQGHDGETIFPEGPEQFSKTLIDFVTRYDVSIVGGCCGSTPEHIRMVAEGIKGRRVKARPVPRETHVSSMIAATPLVQEPRPTMVGERVNSQGSRLAKKMLLEDDYDGLAQIAEDQVDGGAHVLDLCVALVERDDEAEQMRRVAEIVSLAQPAPIQVDSTEPEVIETALEQIPGRAIVNSINLEAGRDKLDRVVPIALAHGACLIALTIDEVGMAKTAQRKLEIAQRLKELCCDEHGLDPEALIFDCLTFTLTTGDEEWRPSAVETIEGIRLIKEHIPHVKTSLGVSNVSFGVVAARARGAELGLPASLRRGRAGPRDGQPEPHHAVLRDRRGRSASSPTTSSSTAARTRWRSSSRTSSRSRRSPRTRRPTRRRAWSPRRRCTSTSCAARRRASRTGSTRCVEKIGAVPTLNDVLLPAMKEVGDKFGAGELILPFVLQSATVMKRAVAQLENYLDKVEGYTKGTVVLATVFGDVHDIGKSLVNTILTNNGYTVVDLGKQVPISAILEAAAGAQGDGDRLSRAARVDLQADAAVHRGALRARAWTSPC